MNPSARGPVYTMDSAYSGNREFFYTNQSPVHTNIESAHLRLSYIIPERTFFFWNFTHQKEFWKISGILGGKSTNSRILEHFVHSPDILSIFHGKMLTKRFLLYSYWPRKGSVRLNATAVSKAPSTEHNKSAAFHQSRLHYNLSAVIHQKGPSLSKKAEPFWEFFGEFQWIFLSEGFAIL